jgi:hypothetical protein
MIKRRGLITNQESERVIEQPRAREDVELGHILEERAKTRLMMSDKRVKLKCARDNGEQPVGEMTGGYSRAGCFDSQFKYNT